jgi:hypothetical protein
MLLMVCDLLMIETEVIFILQRARITDSHLNHVVSLKGGVDPLGVM